MHMPKAQSDQNVRRYHRDIIQSYVPPKPLVSADTTMSPIQQNDPTSEGSTPLAILTGILITILGITSALVWVLRPYLRIMLAIVRGYLIAFRDSGLGPHQIRINIELANGVNVETLHYSSILIDGDGTVNTQAEIESISDEAEYESAHSQFGSTLAITDEDDSCQNPEVQGSTPRLIE